MRGATVPKVNRLKVNDDKNAGRYCHTKRHKQRGST